jgi:hypothetical protein
MTLHHLTIVTHAEMNHLGEFCTPLNALDLSIFRVDWGLSNQAAVSDIKEHSHNLFFIPLQQHIENKFHSLFQIPPSFTKRKL